MGTATSAIDPRATERPLAELRPGDRIFAVRSARTGEWRDLPRPLLTTHPLAPVHLGGPEGVRVYNADGVDHVLYPDSISEVTMVRERGYATRHHAAWAAVTTLLGWTRRGGYYLDHNGEWTGFRSADRLDHYAVTNHMVTQVGTRWYVTGRKPTR